jgi:hypothetical protein
MDAEALYNAWEERAAVRFYDGGLTMIQAEAAAWEDILLTWQRPQTTLEGV